jgi:hypothetical protein
MAGMFKISSILMDSSLWGWKAFAGALGIFSILPGIVLLANIGS